MSSTIVSPTLPGRDELIRPRIVITAILSPLPRAPRCTMTSRNDGVGSSNCGPPPKRRNAVAARTRLMNTLAQSATARKMVRHPSPSFRFSAMTGQTCGDQSRAQEGNGAMEQWLGSCFFSKHEQRWPSPHKRDRASCRESQSAPWSSAEKQRPKCRPQRTARRRHAYSHEKPPPRRAPCLGAKAPDQRLVLALEARSSRGWRSAPRDLAAESCASAKG